MDSKNAYKVIYTKNELMNLFSKTPVSNGVLNNLLENENYIEFDYDDTTTAVIVDRAVWREMKQELSLKQERETREILRMKELEQQDTLTKLYNKEYSREKIEESLKIADLDSKHALMIVDIDNFEIVNETLGYLFGDTVLMNIADNLNEIFYDSDIVARIGGDVFLIFLKQTSSRELLQDKSDEIYSVFSNTYIGENMNYTMSCSIGIAVYPLDGLDYIQLFNNANTALNKAKEDRFIHYCFHQDIKDELKLSSGLSYNNYKITKTRAFGTSNFDKEITTFAFDIMARTKDVNSAINLLLNRMRVHFNCSVICIIENAAQITGFNITYHCGKNGIDLKGYQASSWFNITSFQDYTGKFDENGILNISDVCALQNIDVRSMLNSSGIHSLLQCGMFEDGVFKGIVSIDDRETTRHWTQYEIDSLVTITKIISSYLLKMRASERANNQLYLIRNFDPLTGLPTVHKFKKDVSELLEKNPEQTYAIIYSDITRFKYINDSLGYDLGDNILCDFARLISRDDTKNKGVARISGDNFLAVVPYKDDESLKKDVLSINEEFNVIQRNKYPGNKFVIASGVSVIDPFVDITVAIDNANIARKCVKDSLKTDCKFFDLSMMEKLKKESEITQSMEMALKNGEFIVYLQPKIGLDKNNIVGAEALVRWKKSDNTLIVPDEFIPLFEKNGFIVNLDFYIYEEVCKLIRKWITEGIEVIPISINVSRIHLNDENFIHDIKVLVDKYKVPYDLLELELTESIFLDNTEVAIATMKEFRKIGFGVSIDDFGAGYSSLNLLKDMATDVIKLDKEFFGQGEMHKEERIIVSSIISMAKQLNMKVLSEGVETQNQSDFLKSVSCDMAQGYLYSRPISISEFEEMMLGKTVS